MMVLTMPTSTSAERFARWLYETRKAAKLTQQELADAARCATSYVSMLERATVHPTSGGQLRASEDIVEALAVALGADVDLALLTAGYAPRNSDWLTVRVDDMLGPVHNDPNHGVQRETRELHDDVREEYDRWYQAFAGEPAFEKLSPSEKDAMVRRAMDAAPQPSKPGDFRKAVKESE
jgi:transcriptional regulator with XRE-family HTH domain